MISSCKIDYIRVGLEIPLQSLDTGSVARGNAEDNEPFHTLGDSACGLLLHLLPFLLSGVLEPDHDHAGTKAELLG